MPKKTVVPKPKGRPISLTPEIQKRICDALAIGNYLDAAAAYAGVSKHSIYYWMKKGREQDKGQLRDFYDAVEQAQGQGEAYHVNNIYEKSSDDWKASAWMLDRKFPAKWGKKSIVKYLDGPNMPFDPFGDDKPKPLASPEPMLDVPQANVIIYIPKNNKEIEEETPETKDVN